MKWLLILEGLGASSGPLVTLAVNVLIQSSILIGLGLLLARLFRSRGAAFESAVLRATLMAVILCPLVAIVLNKAGVHTLSIYLPQPITSEPDQFETAAPGISTDTSELTALDRDNSAEVSSEVSHLDTTAETPTAMMTGEIPQSVAIDQPESSDSSILAVDYNLLAVVYGALVIAWITVSICLTSRLLLFIVRLLYVRFSASEATGETVELWRQIAERLNVRTPRILVSDSVVSPCVTGIVRPVVLLPQNEESATMVTREVILHELAHLVRRDCLWIMLSKLAGAVLFFQPLIWVLGRRNQRAAEDVCDDYVVRYSPDRHSYAHQAC